MSCSVGASASGSSLVSAALSPDERLLMIRGGDAPEALNHFHVVLDWWFDIVTR